MILAFHFFPVTTCPAQRDDLIEKGFYYCPVDKRNIKEKKNMKREIFDKGEKKDAESKKNKQKHSKCCVFSKALKMSKLIRNLLRMYLLILRLTKSEYSFCDTNVNSFSIVFRQQKFSKSK